MKDLVKYAGVIVILAGVAILVITGLQNTVTNFKLTFAAILLVAGFIAHILINKFVKD